MVEIKKSAKELMLIFLVFTYLLNIPLASVDYISFIVLQRNSFLASHVMKSSNGQRLTCHIHHTNHLGLHQTCLPSWQKRVICACIREICFFRDFMGLKRQKFSWSLLTRHLYTRQLACEPQTGCLPIS